MAHAVNLSGLLFVDVLSGVGQDPWTPYLDVDGAQLCSDRLGRGARQGAHPWQVTQRLSLGCRALRGDTVSYDPWGPYHLCRRSCVGGHVLTGPRLLAASGCLLAGPMVVGSGRPATGACHQVCPNHCYMHDVLRGLA